MTLHRTAKVSQVNLTEYETVTHAIVASIATLEDIPPTQVPILFGATEPTALNRLFDHSAPNDDLTVKFTIDDYEVTCEKSGTVTSRRID